MNESNIIDPTISWTSSIARHCRNGRLADAAAVFTRMRTVGVEPNYVTFVTLLSGCAGFPSQAPYLGASIHALVRKLGLDTCNVKVGTAIVDMYCKCGRLDLASLSFGEIRVKNKVTWNTMINGCMRNGEFEKAMQLFDEMPNRDVVSYTSLIDGFVKKGHFELALEWFQEMQLAGVEPDHVTFSSILSACANLGVLGLGLWVNRFVLQHDFSGNVRINNSLIDMYSRCGCIDFAIQIFKSMPKRNTVSWNSVIVGCALNGNAEEALEYFNLMQKDGFEPDGVSFTGALSACSHAGFVDEGLKLFDMMKTVYRISPRIEHYGCIVDLYSRAGMLEDALNVIESMPMIPNEVVLGSLLAASRTAADITLAEKLMNYIREVDPAGDSNYVILSNIFASEGNWHSASTVRRKMKDRGIWKKPGISSIEVDSVVHKFVAGDRSHVESEYIYTILEHLSHELRISGYVPKTNAGEQYEYD